MDRYHESVDLGFDSLEQSIWTNAEHQAARSSQRMLAHSFGILPYPHCSTTFGGATIENTVLTQDHGLSSVRPYDPSTGTFQLGVLRLTANLTLTEQFASGPVCLSLYWNGRMVYLAFLSLFLFMGFKDCQVSTNVESCAHPIISVCFQQLALSCGLGAMMVWHVCRLISHSAAQLWSRSKYIVLYMDFLNAMTFPSVSILRFFHGRKHVWSLSGPASNMQTEK